MFLEMLDEHERKIFMELGYLAMECDGEIAKEEEETLSTYAYECKLDDYKRQGKSLKSCLEELKDSSRAHRKIILLELIGIWAADNEWKDEENLMMEEVAKGLAIPPSRMNRLKRWSRELRSMIADGYTLITED